MFSQACVKNSVHGGVRPLGRHSRGAPSPPLEMATEAGGTCPTGMYSCLSTRLPGQYFLCGISRCGLVGGVFFLFLSENF